MLLTQQWWVPYLVRPQTQTWNTRNQHNVHNVRPPHAGNAWWVGCVGCHKCSKCRARAENKKKKMRFCRARWRDAGQPSSLRERNCLRKQTSHTTWVVFLCSTSEGLKMLQTCFLRWWKAQFLDIGLKPHLELGITLKLETFFQPRYLEAFQRLPPDLVMCLADWCSQVGERYVCCGAELASDGLRGLRVSTALETLHSSACCILFSPDFVVSERLLSHGRSRKVVGLSHPRSLWCEEDQVLCPCMFRIA